MGEITCVDENQICNGSISHSRPKDYGDSERAYSSDQSSPQPDCNHKLCEGLCCCLFYCFCPPDKSLTGQGQRRKGTPLHYPTARQDSAGIMMQWSNSSGRVNVPNKNIFFEVAALCIPKLELWPGVRMMSWSAALGADRVKRVHNKSKRRARANPIESARCVLLPSVSAGGTL